MNVWGYILLFVGIATVFILVLSVMATVGITWFAHLRSQRIIKKYLSKLEMLMPGKNCGECGCENCKAYAMDVFSCRKDTDCCTVGGNELTRQLNECMDEFQRVLEPEPPKDNPKNRE